MEYLPENWQVRNTYFKTALGLPRIYEDTTMPGVVQNSKKNLKNQNTI